MSRLLLTQAHSAPLDKRVRGVTGYYQLIEGRDGAFMFTLRAGNHETVLSSRVYWSRQAALDGVVALREASQQALSFVRHSPADGRGWFEVRGPDGQALARSEFYSSRTGVLSGMSSVQRNGPALRFRGLVRRSSLAAAGSGVWALPAQSDHDHPAPS